MYDYTKLKKEYGNRVSQTIDRPIMFMDKWDLWDLGLILAIIFIFGVIFYSWWTMLFLIVVAAFVIPPIKKKNNRGIFIHYFYRHFGVKLPGLFNPRKRQRFSD